VIHWTWLVIGSWLAFFAGFLLAALMAMGRDE